MSQTAITIDATVGGASSNSFLTLADANTLIHARPFHSDWDDITDDDVKNASLVWATRTLSRYRWKGNIVDTDQALPFPRSGLYDHDDRQYADDEIPEWLEFACSELAFIIATEDRTVDSGTEGYSEIKVASIAVKIDKYDRPAEVPDIVYDYFKQWVYQGARYNAEVQRV